MWCYQIWHPEATGVEIRRRKMIRSILQRGSSDHTQPVVRSGEWSAAGDLRKPLAEAMEWRGCGGWELTWRCERDRVFNLIRIKWGLQGEAYRRKTHRECGHMHRKAIWGHGETVAIYNPRWEAPEEMNLPAPWSWLPASRTVRKEMSTVYTPETMVLVMAEPTLTGADDIHPSGGRHWSNSGHCPWRCRAEISLPRRMRNRGARERWHG